MAELDLKLPNLRQGASAEENINELYAYLKKQNEKLKYILNNLDVDSFNDDTKILINNAVKLVETNTEAINSTQTLEQMIKQTADVIEQNINEQITDIEGSITHISNALGAQTVEDLNTQFIQSALGMALKTEVTTLIQSVLANGDGSDLPADYDEAKQYHGYIELGWTPGDSEHESGTSVKIGGQNNNEPVMETVITPRAVEFRKDNEQLAYFGNDDMFIKTVRTLALRFGQKDGNRSFYFDIDTEDGITTLRLKYDAQFDSTYYEDSGD